MWRKGGALSCPFKRLPHLQEDRMIDDVRHAIDEITRLIAENDAIRKALPDWCVLDPPDGGDVKTVEGVHRLAARVKKLEGALRAAYEVYAGSDGFIPETCAEGYQQQIIRQMVDCISAALTQPAKENPNG
jgi:hypothetical protein